MCRFIPDYLVKNVLLNSDKIKLTTRQAFLDMSIVPVQTGALIDAHLFNGNKKAARTVYDAEEKTHLPGKVVREEGSNPVDDEIVNNGYDYSGYTRDYLKKFFNRNSTDNKGFHLHLTTHYSRRYPNAFYNGKQIAVGDGDGEIFGPFMLLDIIGHEWGHGVVDHTANLIYRNMSGALNEHYADVFGICVKQMILNQKPKDANWIIGEGIFKPSINGKGIRNMLHPGTAYDDSKIGRDKQPSHMRDYYNGPEDNGGVHINSSIFNKVFANYSINMEDFAFDKPAKIWYEVLTTKLNNNSNFQNMADALQEVVIQKYGTGIEYKALKEALKSVGLTARHPIFHQMGL